MLRNKLLNLPRRSKRLIQVAVDVLLVWLALWSAFLLRLGDTSMVEPFGGHLWLFCAAPLVSLPFFIKIGMYRAVLRYMGSDALLAILKAVTLSALVLATIIYFVGSSTALVPRSLVIIYWGTSLVLLGGLRLLMRQFVLGDYRLGLPFVRHSANARSMGIKVAVYGAGEAGNQLVAALRLGRGMEPVAFIDDDPNVINRVIAGIKVYKPSRIGEMIEETGVEEVLLAMPSASRARRREILEYLQAFPLHVRSVPGFMDLASGKVKVDDIQEVDVADLLGRDPVPPRKALLESCVRDQVVMVTGAGGSIGAELCRQILGLGPRALILFEHAEFNLYTINAELEERIRADDLPVMLQPVLGTVRNLQRLEDVMRSFGVNTVYHAAAYKHVPLVEHNIGEGVHNNVFGTLNTAMAAISTGVDNFVLISTDKAVRPSSVMGVTKRLAEMVLQALSSNNAEAGSRKRCKTRFTMVRFGNVLGASGSVIPRFRQQILRGGPVTVTDPAMTRYFMTIPEAAQLVIQAGSMGQGGDVFVLDMGAPVRILDLARKMIHLSGLSIRDESNPAGDIAVEFTGLRPGEKLYEELLIGSNVSTTDHAMIMRASEDFLPWGSLKPALDGLTEAIEADDYQRLRVLMAELVQGYQPQEDIVDWLHLQQKTSDEVMH
ncbi:polysaccharide biosynthesis protein [Halopseudomonas salegens]|uniref:NDP-sugar epimerase, includes UDP-GlcNAc-inverting 4,6-dehydratase FlaA1 and capsular polysaccharide biosynthesis protein EpsC n=1 Tax=Halopseudomonas salegens TaxID=1434072 RepID=A0A1H2FLS2_9GAMM|nr:nucleoside-diphosphate sugar epimerase/dehydratase [Halopseudomonas salegens]SDU07888.1 NDP-sugar epimerase, includes UDP-GlcNAc-inverting 4,6-dehydratase FlaA1 and capsular polysaccharide biosynthesis protein EpsC [Halopseudomonas salegens]